MSEARLPRKLAAVFYADVAGYSRLTGEDEEGTHRRLSAHLDILAQSIKSHNGAVVHYAGDAVLAEFQTVTEAMACAVDVQREFRDNNAPLPDERKVQFRIGVNLGEVIVDRDDIYGDGVNVAARLESLAEPGGICVSEAVRGAVGTKLAIAFDDMGRQRVKNIAQPVQAYRVVLDPARRMRGHGSRRPWMLLGAAAAVIAVVAGVLGWRTPWVPREEPASVERMAYPLPDKPSIAVLPFANMSGDATQEYFSDGLTENIITTLSKLPDVFVIARNSTFTYKGQAVKVQRVAEELGVRYVLEGSFQRADSRIRVHAQFIDALSGRHVWAERFDRQWSDVFALQDDITRNIVSALELKLTEDQQARLARRYTSSVEAYDFFLRGQTAYSAYEVERAREMFERAIALDADFARAYGALAYTYYRPGELGPTEGGVEPQLGRALELARTAVAKDPALPQPLVVLAEIVATGDPTAALEAARKAIDLDPNFGDAYTVLAFIRTNAGHADEAVALMEKALRLNPHPPSEYYFVQGRALFFTEQFRASIAATTKAVEINPAYAEARIYLAAAYAQQGQQADAAWEVAQLLAADEGLTVEGIRTTSAALIQDAGYLDTLSEGLRAAGLPEQSPAPHG